MRLFRITILTGKKAFALYIRPEDIRPLRVGESEHLAKRIWEQHRSVYHFCGARILRVGSYDRVERRRIEKYFAKRLNPLERWH